MPKLILTDKIVRDITAPKSGMKIVRDAKVRGLGVRVLPSGTRAFVLDYSIGGQRRIYTIGKFPEWTTAGARDQATELKHKVRYEDFDPAQELKTTREAPTLKDLWERFKKDHLPKLRASTRSDYERMMETDVLPALGNRKAASLCFDDFAKLHRAITARGAPIAANFTMALCSKICSYGVHLRMMEKNPVKGIERNRSQPRNRYLSMDEIGRLTKALAAHPDQVAADIFRLLLLTGARRGETQAAKWEQIDLKEGLWVKPSHATKQKREHRVPLAAPARALLSARRASAEKQLRDLDREIAKAGTSDRASLKEWRRRIDTFVFPAPEGASGHRIEITKNWAALCKAAGIVSREAPPAGKGGSRAAERHSARIHDLRHTAASLLASSGASLPLIGQLLGHTQASTTARYAHLFDTAQRGAVERLGAILEGGPSAEIFSLKEKRKNR